MRSQRGFVGALVILLAVPLAVLAQVLLGIASEITVHAALAAGSGLVASSVFDFGTTRWVAWVGCVSIGALAGIFLAQGVSESLQNDSLSYFTFQVLGNWPERLLIDLFVFWLVAMLLTDSRGRTRIFGFVAVAIVVCLELYGYGLLLFGAPPGAGVPGSKALYLLPIVWLLAESRKKQPKGGS